MMEGGDNEDIFTPNGFLRCITYGIVSWDMAIRLVVLFLFVMIHHVFLPGEIIGYIIGVPTWLVFFAMVEIKKRRKKEFVVETTILLVWTFFPTFYTAFIVDTISYIENIYVDVQIITNNITTTKTQQKYGGHIDEEIPIIIINGIISIGCIVFSGLAILLIRNDMQNRLLRDIKKKTLKQLIHLGCIAAIFYICIRFWPTFYCVSIGVSMLYGSICSGILDLFLCIINRKWSSFVGICIITVFGVIPCILIGIFWAWMYGGDAIGDPDQLLFCAMFSSTTEQVVIMIYGIGAASMCAMARHRATCGTLA
jgi:hypothetical protein